MPGDDWQKFANLRLLFGYMYAQPGKKLLFMGGEFGQWNEWNHDAIADWHLLEIRAARGMQRLVRDLNGRIAANPLCTSSIAIPPASSGSTATTAERSVISFLRKCTRRPRADRGRLQFHAGAAPQLPHRRAARRVLARALNSDAVEHGGSGQGNLGGVEASPVPCFGRMHSLTLTLPPLGAIFLKSDE